MGPAQKCQKRGYFGGFRSLSSNKKKKTIIYTPIFRPFWGSRGVPPLPQGGGGPRGGGLADPPGAPGGLYLGPILGG